VAPGRVAKLTTIAVSIARGVATRIGSTTVHVPVSNVALPKRAWLIPRGAASFACTNAIQLRLLKVPTSILAIAPSLVMRFQNMAPMYMGRKAAAHNPKKMAVAGAMILIGNT